MPQNGKNYCQNKSRQVSDVRVLAEASMGAENCFFVNWLWSLDFDTSLVILNGEGTKAPTHGHEKFMFLLRILLGGLKI